MSGICCPNEELNLNNATKPTQGQSNQTNVYTYDTSEITCNSANSHIISYQTIPPISKKSCVNILK